MKSYLGLSDHPEHRPHHIKFFFGGVAEIGSCVIYASDGLRADQEVVLAAVAQDGWALEYASDGLRADKEVVLAAVAQNGSALQYASEGLRADLEVE